MNKIAIIYASIHHQNTKKVVECLTSNLDADAIDVIKETDIDISSYETVILASGIYFNNIHKKLFELIQSESLANKEVFLIYTCGIPYKDYAKSARKALKKCGANYIGEASCRGYDTYGILAKLGGIIKGHPTKNDLRKIYEKVIAVI